VREDKEPVVSSFVREIPSYTPSARAAFLLLSSPTAWDAVCPEHANAEEDNDDDGRQQCDEDDDDNKDEDGFGRQQRRRRTTTKTVWDVMRMVPRDDEEDDAEGRG
jgi:hypothetical protein